MENLMKHFPWNPVQRALALLLASLLCGIPEAVAQSAQSAQAPPAQTGSQQQAAPAQKPNQSLDVDPSKGPLQPVTPSSPDASLPNAPSASQPAAQNLPSTQDQTQQAPPATAPQGVAVAGEARTNGGPASKPAGTAIAPAKQRQMRSLLIKIGAIGAGAAALGVVYGLTRSTSSHP